MKAFIHELQETNAPAAFSAFAALPYSLFFDSADRAHPASRYSFIAALPLETIEAKNGRVTITGPGFQDERTGDPLEILQQRLDHHRINDKTLPGLPPFQGGAAGFFGYDLGRAYENIPSTAKDNANIPDMAMGIYDQVIAFDHLLDKAFIITQARDEHDAKIKQRMALKVLDAAGTQAVCEPVDLPWEPNFDAFEYTQAVDRVIEYIRAGDIFQANISQRFDADLPVNFNAFAHYARLRRINPAPFAGFMNFGTLKISSASPERFLTLVNGEVETRPIKGTAPRAGNPATDRIYRDTLESSEKNRAENTMIVDLLRNDLSKVCEADSIEVRALCILESFASVHHLVSTITGKLENGKCALDLLRACFPGGSITGAPKIRAMEIIEEMEPTRRGAYCGTMGYIGFDGTMDSNILIRTLVYDGQNVSFQTGGGITAGSDADAEYQETFDKAHAIFRSFEDSDVETDADFLALAAGL